MQVILFSSFSKRENSTLRPVPGSGVEFPCILKEQTSVLSPIIRLKFDAMTVNPSIYNYAFIPDFGRYYWVRDWVSDNRLWSAVLQVDVLASWREEIGSQSQYILRSSHSYNPSVTDEFYPATSNFTTNTDYYLSPFTPNEGVYVLGVVGTDGGGAGGCVGYYETNSIALGGLIEAMLSTTDYLQLDPEEISSSLAKCILNPMQYLTNMMYYPIESPVWGLSSEIKCGWWNTGIYGYSIRRPMHEVELDSEDVILGKHPLADSRGTYLNHAPWSRYGLYVPGFGTFSIDSTLADWSNNGTIHLSIKLDVITGIGVLTITGAGGVLMDKREAKIGIDVPLAQITQDYVTGASSMVNAVSSAIGGVTGSVGSLLKGNIFGSTQALLGGIGGVIDGVGNAAKAVAPTVVTSGSQGSSASVVGNIVCWQQRMDPVEEDRSNLGRPLCTRGIPSSYPGFLLVKGADIDAPATADEISMIKSYMNGGFFYE